MTIGIDMMGGDFAPLEAVKGVQLYLSGHNIPAKLVLVGDQVPVKKILNEHKLSMEHIRIIHAEEVIDMHESPSKALKKKPKSSISIGFALLC